MKTMKTNVFLPKKDNVKKQKAKPLLSPIIPYVKGGNNKDFSAWSIHIRQQIFTSSPSSSSYFSPSLFCSFMVLNRKENSK